MSKTMCLGYRFDARPGGGGSGWRHYWELEVTVPYWLLTTLFLLPVLPRFVDFMRQTRRKKRNHCTKCNYDLRAHKPGAKCPECGTPIPWTDESVKASTKDHA